MGGKEKEKDFYTETSADYEEAGGRVQPEDTEGYGGIRSEPTKAA